MISRIPHDLEDPESRTAAGVLPSPGQVGPARTGEEAKALLDATLNGTEDELSGVPNNPETWQTDGRMYPAQDDSAADVTGHPEVTSYRSRGHETLVRDNGAIEIREAKTKKLVFAKRGADGRGVWQ